MHVRQQPIITITDGHAAESIPLVRRLFRDYAAWLDEHEGDMCIQKFDAELASLPGRYAPPLGAVQIAWVEGKPAGCVAMRPLEPGICEMKRLWVAGEFRGLGIGRKLASDLLKRAKRAGHERMRLDTLHRMESARALYESLGFRAISAYNDNPLGSVLYFEKQL